MTDRLIDSDQNDAITALEKQVEELHAELVTERGRRADMSGKIANARAFAAGFLLMTVFCLYLVNDFANSLNDWFKASREDVLDCVIAQNELVYGNYDFCRRADWIKLNDADTAKRVAEERAARFRHAPTKAAK